MLLSGYTVRCLKHVTTDLRQAGRQAGVVPRAWCWEGTSSGAGGGGVSRGGKWLSRRIEEEDRHRE